MYFVQGTCQATTPNVGSGVPTLITIYKENRLLGYSQKLSSLHRGIKVTVLSIMIIAQGGWRVGASEAIPSQTVCAPTTSPIKRIPLLNASSISPSNASSVRFNMLQSAIKFFFGLDPSLESKFAGRSFNVKLPYLYWASVHT
jgi:hypothetical protein